MKYVSFLKVFLFFIFIYLILNQLINSLIIKTQLILCAGHVLTTVKRSKSELPNYQYQLPCMWAKLLTNQCPPLATPQTIAYQAPLSMGFSRQEYWSVLPFHSPVSYLQIRSDQISPSVVSNSLRPHESQHARPPYPSPTPRVH